MPKKYSKCFVTVGTTRFDLLAEYITSTCVLEALREIGCEELTFQIGNSAINPEEYEKEGIKLSLYRFKNSIQEDINNADVVISHAGAGSCLEALEAHKPLLVVINEELMDNHQLELAEQLQVDGHLYYCTCDTLESTLKTVDFNLLTPLPKPNCSLFVKYLDDVFKVKST